MNLPQAPRQLDTDPDREQLHDRAPADTGTVDVLTATLQQMVAKGSLSIPPPRPNRAQRRAAARRSPGYGKRKS